MQNNCDCINLIISEEKLIRIRLGKDCAEKLIEEANSEMVKIMMKVGWSQPAGDGKDQLLGDTRPLKLWSIKVLPFYLSVPFTCSLYPKFTPFLLFFFLLLFDLFTYSTPT